MSHHIFRRIVLLAISGVLVLSETSCAQQYITVRVMENGFSFLLHSTRYLTPRWYCTVSVVNLDVQQ